MSDGISSRQAELGAVQKVCEYLKSKSEIGGSAVIHCDSMPASQTINSSSTTDLFSKQKDTILNLLIDLVKVQGIHVTFHWIPLHIGITGNDKVDMKAKEVLEKPHIDFENLHQ